MKLIDIGFCDCNCVFDLLRDKRLGFEKLVLGHEKLIQFDLVKMAGTVSQSLVAVVANVGKDICDRAFEKSRVERRAF